MTEVQRWVVDLVWAMQHDDGADLRRVEGKLSDDPPALRALNECVARGWLAFDPDARRYMVTADGIRDAGVITICFPRRRGDGPRRSSEEIWFDWLRSMRPEWFDRTPKK